LFYGQRNRTYQQEASGSGVIISEDGYIATNNHVIEGADEISVTLNNSESYTAELIGRDPSTDLALLKIKAKDLAFVEFANSDDVKVGEWVLAVGNPFNLTSTVTAGIVSAKARSINILKGDSENDIFPIESFIQTDAAVNPGNSGGALVNTSGQLIGINTAIASKTGSYSGYSFAVPSNMVQKVTSDLLNFGIVQRGFIGVGLAEINQDMITELNLPNLKGVLVTGVIAESAGADAGLKQGDVILKVGDAQVNKVPSLQENIGKFSPGDKVLLTVRRGNEEKIVPIILKNKDGNTGVVAKEVASTTVAMGVTFEDVSQKTKTSLQINDGVRISSIGAGKFKSAGIPEGFIITKIDQKSVTNAEDVSNYISKKKGGILIEGIYPNGMKGYFGFGL
jgi:Do/DeqQ family serine protease